MQRDLEIDLLRAFVAVAEQQNFTRAGVILGRSQSAVSLQIKRLETIVGLELFYRTKKTVKITQSGETLKIYADRLLSLNDEALSCMKEPEANGLVRIGAPDDYATYLLPDLLSSLSRKHPRIQIEVTCENSTELLPLFKQAALDLILTTHQLNGVSGEVLRRERVHWVAARDFIVPETEAVPLVLFSAGSAVRTLAMEALGKMQKPWRIAYSTRSISLIENAVKTGAGVAVMEASIIPKGFKILDGSDGFPSLPDVMMCLHSQSVKNSPAIKLAYEHLKKELGAK